FDLGKKIIEVKLIFANSPIQALGFLLVECILCLFNQGDDIPHAQDATRHAIRVESVDGVHLLSGADKFYRFVNYATYRQRRTTARVAIQLGEHDAVKVEAFIKRLRRVDSILTRHGVDNKKRLR